MVTIRDLLRVKGDDVWSVTPKTCVLDTLIVMADKGVGALLIMEGSRIAGIFSERDFARAIAKTGQCILDHPVGEYMTTQVVTIEPDQSVEECMQMMTREHIRHLPVMEDRRLIGLISIGDVVREIISSKESTIDTLENFIEGRGYGH
ncbi:MAG: CBS domain-containing protein [Anaerolineae bacterium]|nr:CBS domain-containing protein [Anaerolineae bacterium]